MANRRDIMGLLTGIPSQGISPLSALTPQQIRAQAVQGGIEAMGRGMRGLMTGERRTPQQIATAQELKKLKEAEANKVEGIGQINPQFYTPESIEAFRKYAEENNGKKDYSLLKEVDLGAKTYKAEMMKKNVTSMDARSASFQNSASLQLKTKQMQELLDSGLQTGALAGLTKSAKSFVQSFFPDVEISGLKEAEVFGALSNQLALLVRNPKSDMGLPGATSNRDLSFLIDSVPNLQMSVAGNKLLLEVYDKTHELKASVMKEQARIIRENGGVPPLDLTQQLDAFVERTFTLGDDLRNRLQQEAESGVEYDNQNLQSILEADGYGVSEGKPSGSAARKQSRSK